MMFLELPSWGRIAFPPLAPPQLNLNETRLLTHSPSPVVAMTGFDDKDMGLVEIIIHDET
jgi:hypothetical protein